MLYERKSDPTGVNSSDDVDSRRDASDASDADDADDAGDGDAGGRDESINSNTSIDNENSVRKIDKWMYVAMFVNAIGELGFGITRRIIYSGKKQCNLFHFQTSPTACHTIVGLMSCQAVFFLFAFACMVYSLFFVNIANIGRTEDGGGLRAIARFKLQTDLLFFPSILSAFYIIVEFLYAFYSEPINLIALVYDGVGLPVFFVSGLYYAEYLSDIWCKLDDYDNWQCNVFGTFLIHVGAAFYLLIASVLDDLNSIESATSQHGAFILVVTSNALAIEWIHILVSTKWTCPCCTN